MELKPTHKNYVSIETEQRIGSQRARIIDLLNEAGELGVTNIELQRISLRYTAHVTELRNVGYKIVCTPISEEKGIFNYVLERTPLVQIEATKAMYLFLDFIDSYDDQVPAEAIKQFLSDHKFNVVRNWGAYL